SCKSAAIVRSPCHTVMNHAGRLRRQNRGWARATQVRTTRPRAWGLARPDTTRKSLRHPLSRSLANFSLHGENDSCYAGSLPRSLYSPAAPVWPWTLGVAMPFLRCLLACLLLLGLGTAGPRQPAAGGAPQWRAFWVDAFNPGIKTPEQVERLVADLKALHCNTVFAQ